jgi:hypothetical protein
MATYGNRAHKPCVAPHAHTKDEPAMTTAITHPATISVSIRKQRVDMESTSTLKAIARNLNAIANKETPLRIKLDGSGQLRLKAMPEKLSFLARTFSGARYAKEATRASEYFGLTKQVTACTALSMTNPLTDTLLLPFQKPFNALTPIELGELDVKLSSLGDTTVLQVDAKGNVRTARPGTEQKHIDDAKIAFTLDDEPTVASIKSLIKGKLADSLVHIAYKQSYNTMQHAQVVPSSDHPVRAPQAEVHRMSATSRVSFGDIPTEYTYEREEPSREVIVEPPYAEAARSFVTVLSEPEVVDFVDLVTFLHSEKSPAATVLAQLATELCEGLHGSMPPSEYVDQAFRGVQAFRGIDEGSLAEISRSLLSAYGCFLKATTPTPDYEPLRFGTSA